MFDIFTEEIETQIREGIANLYWFHGDFRKAWLHAGVPEAICKQVYACRNADGSQLTKRKYMDELYMRVRMLPFDRKLEISRNFVRFLVEHKNFRPQNERHHIDRAERCALKLREIIRSQRLESEKRDSIVQRAREQSKDTYEHRRSQLQQKLAEYQQLLPQKRGYKLQDIISELMAINQIPVQRAFRIVGEEIDGSIKYEGHHYLIEVRWRKEPSDQSDIAGLYLKVEGKMGGRGIFLSMNGYSPTITQSLPAGKHLRVILLDGRHLTNVISGLYTMKQLLDFGISEASTRGNIYCSPDLRG